MDPSDQIAANVSHWNETLASFGSGFFSLARWALNCPHLKRSSGFFFSSSSRSQSEPLTFFTAFYAFSTDIFAVFFTLVAAYCLEWIVNYFIRFCASCGYVLSGSDLEPTSTPPSAPPSPPRPSSLVGTPVAPDLSQSTVKMNEPVDCSMSRTGITGSHPSLGLHVTYRHPSSPKSTLSTLNSRLESGLDVAFEEPDLDDRAVDMITVYAAPNKPTGSISLSNSGQTEFVWLDTNYDKISVTGSFVGFSLSFPLTREEDRFRTSMKLPPGNWNYEFIAEHRIPGYETY